MRVLCIAPHPDDETIGCGGTLLRHIADGDDVFWLIVTLAAAPAFGEDVISRQRKQIDAVEAAYGFAERVELGLAVTTLDSRGLGDLVGEIAAAVARIAPETVYLNHGGDAHSDHRMVFAAATAAMKPFRSGRTVRRIYSYETISETDQAPPRAENAFLPTAFVDISAQIDRKLEILNLYESELQPFPLPREESAVRAVARVRGAACGVAYAEALVTLREMR